MLETVIVNGTKYRVIRFMGKGKGGYSYLAVKDEKIELEPRFLSEEELMTPADVEYKHGDFGLDPLTKSHDAEYLFDGYTSVPKQYVLLKQIHHEPCDYYTFGNKIASEMRDYQTLSRIGLRIPKMYSVDEDAEIIIKEFIDGPTVMSLLEKSSGSLPDSVIEQAREMAKLAKSNGINIDYYPTNFVLDKNGLLYYIDYECNAYMDEWSFDNWGAKYWTKTKAPN